MTENNIALKKEYSYPKHAPWIMWGVLALAYVAVQFHRISPAVIMEELILDYQIQDAAVAGLMVSMYAVVYMAMQIPSGLMADYWGPRKTVSAGMLTAGAGTILFALSDALWLAFIGRALIGLGVAVIMVSVMKFQVSWFKPAQFATLTGLTMLVGNLGKAAGTSPLAFMAGEFGWRNSFHIVAAFTFLIAALCWFVVKDHPGSVRSRRGRGQTTAASPVAWKQVLSELLLLMKCREVWFIFLGIFGLSGVALAFSGTWSSYYLIQVYGLSSGESSFFLLLFTIGLGIGSPIIGYLSDRFNQRKFPLMIMYIFNIILWLAMAFWHGGKPPQAALYVIYFSMGFFLSGMTLIFSLAKDLNGTVNPGTALGLVNISPFAGMALLQPFFGIILDLRWQGLYNHLGAKVYPVEAYRLLFLSCIVIMIISFYFILRINETSSAQLPRSLGARIDPKA